MNLRRLRQFTGWYVILAVATASPRPLVADDKPARITPRTPNTEADLQRWLANMLQYHRFSREEAAAATGLTVKAIDAAVEQGGLELKGRAAIPADRLLMLPYPGGRHPRIGFREGAIDPQRETKVSVFTPWHTPDAPSYVVVDCPEALWSNLGLTYLAHTHVPTIWSNQGIELPRQEWEQPAPDVLSSTRELPNGIVFQTRVTSRADHIDLWMQLRNGTAAPLSDLRVQMCVMLKGAPGFDAQTNDNKQAFGAYACVRDAAGTRWIVSAWKPNHRTWFNPPCPCLHSDPRFPDCGPDESRELRGWLSFYAGHEIEGEIARIESLKWWETPVGAAPNDLN
jgi:hypothetical protein